MATLIGSGGHADDIHATLNGWRRIHHHSVWDGDPTVIIGINDPHIRAKAAADLGIEDLSWVHPDANLYGGMEIGHGTHINYGVMMTRTRIGTHTTIAPGVHCAGDVAIGSRVFVGIGATISNFVTIGDDAIIGAGAVLPPNTIVPVGETWVGNPARRLR